MKKLLIASLILATSHSTFAADSKVTAKPDAFAQATKLYEAKNYPAAFQEMQRLADTGNAQAIYNLGSLYTTNFTEPLSYQGSAFLKLPKFP